MRCAHRGDGSDLPDAARDGELHRPEGTGRPPRCPLAAAHTRAGPGPLGRRARLGPRPGSGTPQEEGAGIQVSLACPPAFAGRSHKRQSTADHTAQTAHFGLSVCKHRTEEETDDVQ